jgi:Ni2+-binding GTPase involved in maturation of urease and hydrogenase
MLTTRLVIVGGFLGAGKTTAILKLARHWIDRGKRVGVIANDQAKDLVDTALFRGAGLQTSEVAGGCFCCRFDDFLARADELTAAGQPDVILAEPVGSCTDIVATIMNPLRALHGGRFEVAPFTVLVDPIRALNVLGEHGTSKLSEKITYIFRMQQQEAQGIAITKIDLIDAAQRDEVAALLRSRLPDAQILAFSAATGDGFADLVAWLEGDGGTRPSAADVDYDIYAAGEAELGWLNTQASLEASDPMSVDEAAMDLATRVRRALVDSDVPIAHAKVFLRGPRAGSAVNIVGNDAPPQFSNRSGDAARAVELTVNVRAQASPQRLHDLFEECLSAWIDAHHATVLGGSGQCFSPARPVPTHRLAGAIP